MRQRSSDASARNMGPFPTVGERAVSHRGGTNGDGRRNEGKIQPVRTRHVFSRRRNTETEHERTRERGPRMERAIRVVCERMLRGEVEGQDSQESSELGQRSSIVSNRRDRDEKRGTHRNAATKY